MRITILAVTTLCVLGSASASAQDASVGATLFKQRCSVCHSVDSNAGPKMGPTLAGVANRKAGATAFNYSAKLKASDLRWDKATLDKYLMAPQSLVPGTRMTISVADAKQRAAIVAYISGLK